MKNSKNSLLAASVALLVLGVNVSAVEAAGPARSVEMRGALERTGVGRQTAAPVSRTLVTTKSVEADCGRTLNSCMIGKVGYNLSCGVPAWQVFGRMSLACSTSLRDIGGVCAAAATYCTKAGDTAGYLPTPTTTPVVGTMYGYSDPVIFGMCPSNAWVDQVKVEFTPCYQRVSKLIFRCTPQIKGGQSTFLTFGVPAIADTRTGIATCAAGRLAGGMAFRAGTELDAAGLLCKNVADFNETLYGSSIYGGAGGSFQYRACPRQTHLVGAKVSLERKGAPTDNIAGVELICR